MQALLAGGARMTASASNFTVNWPSSATWNPAAASSKDALAADLTPAKIAVAQAMYVPSSPCCCCMSVAWH